MFEQLGPLALRVPRQISAPAAASTKRAYAPLFDIILLQSNSLDFGEVAAIAGVLVLRNHSGNDHARSGQRTKTETDIAA